MKIFHFYSNVLGTNFSAEMRFLGGPDRNMGSGQRIKAASSEFCQKYSSALCAFYQSFMKSMIMSENKSKMLSSGNPAAIIRLGRTSFATL